MTSAAVSPPSSAAAAAPKPAAAGDARWWLPVIYPAAFPVGLVVLTWGEASVNILEIIRPLVVALLIALATSIVANLLAGDRRFGGIATTAVMVALVVDRTEACLVLFAVAVGIVVLARLPGARTMRSLSIVTLVLALLSTIAFATILLAIAGRPGIVDNITEAFLAPPGPAERPMPPPGTPDIFVYLDDGYPGAQASEQAGASFDATAFPDALRQRGFTVHDDSRTNYLITRMVIPTMFEGRHLDDIPALAAPFGPDQAVDAQRLRSVMEHAAGLAAIRAAGYDVMWVSSGFSHLDIRNVDRRIEAPGPSELEVAIMRQSFFGTIIQTLDPAYFSEVMRDRIKASYDAATALAAEPHSRPRFVFVHVPAPHPPTVFKADGSAEDGSPDASVATADAGPESTELRRQRTFEQVTEIGDLTINGIDSLQAAGDGSPVIIVFSDHGTDIGWDPNAPLTSDLRERPSAILATLTPGHPDLYQAPTTTVNIIGTLTNAYLGTTVPHQPDVTYAYKGSVLDTVPIEVTPGN
jgi:hypothetical protein